VPHIFQNLQLVTRSFFKIFRTRPGNDPAFFENPQQLSQTFFKISSSRSGLFSKSSAAESNIFQNLQLTIQTFPEIFH